jgi:ABC-type glycerol-3-phosphate transport system permease component
MKERKMDKRFLFLTGLIIIIAILPFIYAASIEDTDSVKQQIGANAISYSLPSDVDAQKILTASLKNNPELHANIRNALLVIIFLTIFLIIDIILKGFAMWRASKKNSRVWFWILLLVNSLGILPLLYLIFSKKPGLENKKK